MKQEIEKITAVTLLVDCLELGEISAVKASALAVSRMKKKNVLTEFYERQLARGKSKMSALIALAHKILRIASAILKKKQKWNPNLNATPT